MSESKDSKPKRPVEPPVAVSESEAAGTKIASVPALPQATRRSEGTAPERLLATYRDAVASFGAAQNAIAKGMKAVALEVTDLAQTTLSEAGDSAAALMHSGNFAAATEIQLGYARRSVASLVASSTRLSEIGASLMADASRALIAPPSGSTRIS